MASKKKKGGAGASSAPRQAVKAGKKAAPTKAEARKTTAKKAPAKKAAAKKAAAKKAAAKKAAAKKAAAKKAAAKKAAARKAAARKATARKATAKKATAKKATAKKATAKKATAKKATAKKATAKKKTAPKKTAPKKAGSPRAAKKTAVKKSAAKKAPSKKVAPKKAKRPAAAEKATPRKKVARKPAGRKAAAARSRKTVGPRTSRRRWKEAPVVPPGAIPGLSEEDQIRSAKYLPRELPKRLFEEERFLFPESYGVNRVRLLVRDPEWVFAYWDVSAETMKSLARTLGERAFKLSRLTLRVLDPVSGGTTDILLPSGSRWWYIRTDVARRTYRAEIGITLPSGEFRPLAESNSVVTPRVGPSRERARRRLSYAGAGDVPPEEAAAAGKADREAGLATGPWVGDGEAVDSGDERGGASESFRPARPGGEARPGASDAFRPGASDTRRR